MRTTRDRARATCARGRGQPAPIAMLAGLAILALVMAAACGDGGALPRRDPASSSLAAVPAVTVAVEATASVLSPPASPEPATSGAAPAGANRFRPPAGASWQWQLSGEVSTRHDADVYDVDLFDTPDAVIAALHGAGRSVICYFSAGSREDWRPDAEAFPPGTVGEPLGDWEGERWLDVRSPAVMAVLAARLDLARERGCDAVEPDNVDAFTHETGFAITEADQIAFNRALAHAAHARGLAVGLKNAPELLSALADVFDFAITEQCHEQGWCEELSPFIASGKPVFNAEYAADLLTAGARANAVCGEAHRLGIATLVLPLELDDTFRVACPTGR